MKLKLTGINAFTSPLIGNAVLQRGDETTVTADVGAQLLSLETKTLNDNVTVPFFTEVEGGPVEVAPPVAVAKTSDTPEDEDPAPAPAPAPRPAVKATQRKR